MQRQAGFSLIEIMVALTIMALATGVVVMTVGAPGGGLSVQTDRLIAGLEAARDRALSANRHVSVEITPAGFRTITHSLIAGPALAPLEAWPDGLSVSSPQTDLPLMIRFDPVGLAEGGVIELSQGKAGDGVIVEPSGRVRRLHEAP